MIPDVWVVTAYRAGERAQILALAEALGWPFQIKEIKHKPKAWRTNIFRGSDLSGIDLQGSSSLTQPWPDLLISAGMRNEPVCRWIKAQSGGRSKIVHIGRPWARSDYFDLIITTPQYRLPERVNILQNTTTLHRVTKQRLDEAAQLFSDEVSVLPGPYIAVIVGGNSGPYTLGKFAARRLAQQCNELAEKKGASLLITTSARTSEVVAQTLETQISVPKHIYRWQKEGDNNPYFAYLALADELVVTADSVSMLTEACATGKPVHMFDLGVGRNAMQHYSAASGKNDFRLTGSFYRFAMAYAPQRASRDIQLVHHRLIEDGHAIWLGDQLAEKRPASLKAIDRAVACVKQLFPAG